MNYQPQPVQPPANQYKMPEQLQNIGNNVSKTLENASNTVSDSFKDFSDSAKASIDSTTEASSGFLQSNSLFAKFAFVILIVIVFIFILSLGILLLEYFLSPSENPFVVRGMLDGNDGLTVPQNPADSDAVTIKRSNNEDDGMEFTWSIWIYVNELQSDDQYQMFQHIFNKGNDSYDVNGVANVSNGPGLYIKQKVNTDADNLPNTLSLFVIMDSKNGLNLETTGYNQENTKEINDIPIKKWVNVIIRMKNTLCEVYINGVVSGRLQYTEAPLQNYYDVNVCKNGGINGKISNLRYYNKALTIFEINDIVTTGPDLNTYNFDRNKLKTYNYLSSLWYTSKLY